MDIFCSLIYLWLVQLVNCDETNQHYLQNAIRTLKNLKTTRNIRRIDKHLTNEYNGGLSRSHQVSDEVPPLTLTKGELAALYQEAVRKGETLKLDTGDHEYIHAAVHHLDSEESIKEPFYHEESAEIPTEDSGYYYYYYPLKSFFDKLTHPTDASTTYHKYLHPHKELTTYKPPFTYHSHHHQHNITINQETSAMKKEKKPLEPLFMAISGFVGMAVMALVSMVLVPKFGMKGNQKPKNGNEKLDDLTKLAIRAIEGHCAERFACELTKTARSFSIEDNRFYKLLKRIAPGTFGRYMSNSEKYANKHLKCTAIPCAKKKPPLSKKTTASQKKKTNSNKRH
ncbi:uncharacterized protein LOC115882272 isoform X2 [Sitophilus oryzae]|uniref:Uncharacterized protein LOC115882272 isoform X2 n=1 Tax=Sitophilus oryzae TaxID=7048 RepID=A0A6J2XX31_SITOR|nr:uncharacterized protein LOC115882272 isoform X2 [Sitophilus oryzae]